MTSKDELERFQTGAAKYAAYLETPEGQLRLDLTFANLQDLLPSPTQSLRALDIGGGTGAIAVRLAQLGLRVTLLDASVQMLDFAKRAAHHAGVTERIALKHGDATQVPKLLDPEPFDLILCHNILEYVEDPCAVLSSASRALRDSLSIVSILVRNQAGDVMKSAIRDGDLAAAEHNLTAEWGHESLYGGSVRLFTAESLQGMLLASSLTVTAKRGVRVASDYLPSSVSRKDNYERILELERKLGRRPDFAPIARYTHWLAHRAAPVVKDGA